MNDLTAVVDILRGKDRILIFSGAGISTESGIPDFRGPEGLWKTVDPDDFHIRRYLTNPDLRIRSWALHAEGKRWGGQFLPNRGHDAVVDLWTSNKLAGVVTQNIDGLQQAAGLPANKIAELHGSATESHCLTCSKSWPTDEILKRVTEGDVDPHCEACGGIIKTRIVMFGEELDQSTMNRAMGFLSEADALIVLGSTVAVYPASEVVYAAARKPIPVVIINMGETEADHLASARIDGPIGELFPAIVTAVLAADQ
jgi:NAD-dependent protein deacetylase/lipoamidase